ncbi:MAG: hypothetical protein HY393_01345 [Candidatus Diapherotrites archaeon]|nr:hypothetical protein [Candidatus Diapherotrites archaeon]
MQRFHVIKTVRFEEKCADLTAVERQRVERFLEQLAENQGMVGKPLGFHFFREKKFNGKRLYFLVYPEWKAVLAVGISGKKVQPCTIAEIKANLSSYKEFVQIFLMNRSLI